MKIEFFLLSLLLAGCQTMPPVVKPLPDAPPLRAKPENYADRAPRATAPAPPEATSVAPGEPSVPPAQVIEALMAQNDALTARLHARENSATGTPPPAPAAAATPAIAEPPAAEPPPPTRLPAPAESAPPAASVTPSEPTPLLAPNAEGVIDTTALAASGAPANPFAVRTLPTAAVREVSFAVQGIIQGARLCALINGRVAEAGDAVESLRLTRLEPEALVLSGDGFAINLPLGATRVRLAL